MSAAELDADRELQQRLLGVKMDTDLPPGSTIEEDVNPTIQVLTVKRAGRFRGGRIARGPRGAHHRRHDTVGVHQSGPRRGGGRARETRTPEPRVVEFPLAQTIGRAAYIAGTFDTKGRELFYLKTCLSGWGCAR